MFPPALAVAFTVAFVATGVYALTRYVQLSAPGPDHAVNGPGRAVELLHLLMSLAMIAMAWGLGGGPTTGSGVVQLAVFGAFTLGFTLLAVRARVPGDVSGGATPPRFLSCSAHAVTSAAMVWMVAAMPLLMGHSAAADGAGGGHAGHGGHDAAAMTDMAATPAPGWAIVVNGLAAVLLVASAVFWAGRARRAFTASGPTRCGGGPRPGPAAAPSSGTNSPDAAGTVATLAPPTPPRAARARGVLAASCHTLMSLGMAAMLLAMA